MADKNLNISNMNGATHDDEQTCGITDMNCVGDAQTASSLNNMNSVSNDEDKTCGITDMNCLGGN